MRYAIDIAPLGDAVRPGHDRPAGPRRRGDRLGRPEHLGLDRRLDGGRGGRSVRRRWPRSPRATERLRLIASVIVLPRRRPQLVAQAAATLDRLSDGRLVLGVGAGADPATSSRSARPLRWPKRVARHRRGARRDRPVAARGGGRGWTSGAAEVAIGPRPSSSRGRRSGSAGCGRRRSVARPGWTAGSPSRTSTTARRWPCRPSVGRWSPRPRERAVLGRPGEPFDVAVFGFPTRVARGLGPRLRGDGRDLVAREPVADARVARRAARRRRGRAAAPLTKREHLFYSSWIG